METEFDMDNFEYSLKQHADQFSMVPSKRVWNGVYNSLHPGSKWPSLTMLLIFLLTLVGIGPLNHSSSNYTVSTLPDNSQNSIAEESAIADDSGSKIFSMNTYLKTENRLSENSSSDKAVSLNTPSEQNTPVKSRNIESQAANSTDDIYINKTPRDNPNIQNNNLASAKGIVQEKESEFVNEEAPVINIHGYKEDITSTIPATGISINKVPDNQHSIGLSENIIPDDSHSLSSFLKSNPGIPVLIQVEDDVDNVNAENEVTSDMSALKKSAKRNSKTTWIFYATPAITTTYFTGKSLENPDLNTSSLLILNPNQIGNTMRYNARVGLNLGAEMNYEFADNWEVITGTQLSYSGYNILAHKVHPTFSFLYLRDGDNSIEPRKYITYYGSGEGLDEVVLHNTSIQLSLPIGVKYSVWKSNNVEIKIGTSLQPSFVLNGHAYILSADGRNYVTDPDLMRNVNLSGELNSSISFQGEKIKWHIGPTIRYQALSSFKNIYPVNEHLIDYGIRIGISK